MNDDTDRFSEVIGTSEDEQDFGPISQTEIAGVAVGNTDWTTETILAQLRKGNIQLNPRFQRRDAWEPKRKSQFIESLILGLPVPQIVLAERTDQKGTYIVLDGKQRLLCLRQFTAASNDVDFQTFRLEQLAVRKELNGKSFDDLNSDFNFRGNVTALENYGIRAVVLRNWKSEKLLGHIFLRLNMGSKPLSPQELRQALHPGPFLDFADEASLKSSAIRGILGKAEPDFRMRDVELIIRYFSFRHLFTKYAGNLKEFLDDACAEFNKNWKNIGPNFNRETEELDQHYAIIRDAFGANYNFGKWADGKFETRFNRAVFDVMMQALVIPGMADTVRKAPQTMVNAFKELCSNDRKFLDSIERTTKSIEATTYRFATWYSALCSAYGIGMQSVNP